MSDDRSEGKEGDREPERWYKKTEKTREDSKRIIFNEMLKQSG